MKWYFKSIEFSSNTSSELSLIDEYYFEQMRKSTGIPKELLTYSKIDSFKKNSIVFIRSTLLKENFFDLSLLLFPIYFLLNKTNDDQINTPLSETNFQHSNINNMDE